MPWVKGLNLLQGIALNHFDINLWVCYSGSANNGPALPDAEEESTPPPKELEEIGEGVANPAFKDDIEGQLWLF